MLIIVLSVAASALIGLAVCAYCARRRRRIAVFAPGPGPLPFPGGPAPARNCPTPVRCALPHKPYVPPEKSPLPGARDECEVDCCSICLVEFEGGEEVTVLPCRHYYHGEPSFGILSLPAPASWPAHAPKTTATSEVMHPPRTRSAWALLASSLAPRTCTPETASGVHRRLAPAKLHLLPLQG